MNRLKQATISVIALCFTPAYCQSHPDGERQGRPLVSLQIDSEIPLKVIGEIAIQTGVPIGIAFGADQEGLCRRDTALHVANSSVQEAAERVAKPLGFTTEIRDGVLLLEAPDLTPLQRSILDHKFPQFPQQSVSSMGALGTRLTGAIRMQIGNEPTFAASTLHSPDSHHVSLKASSDLTTEDIANQIVRLDKHGIWIFSGAAPKLNAVGGETPSPKDARIVVFSYADDVAAIRDITCQQ